MSDFYSSGYSWGSSYGPSCVCLGQRILTPTGWEGLENLLRRFKAGHRVEVMVTNHLTGQKMPSPLLLGLETIGRATRLTLEDGRSVELTDGHAVPAERQRGDLWGATGGVLGLRRVNLHPAFARNYQKERRFRSDEELAEIAALATQTSGRIIHHENVEWSLNVVEWEKRWAPIAVGDVIDGSPVIGVERLGLRNAARLGAAHFGWLTVGQRGEDRGFQVGQRFHEYHGSWAQADHVRLKENDCSLEIGPISAVVVSPLLWGPTWDYSLTFDLAHKTVDVVQYQRKGGPRGGGHFIGPAAGAISWNETEAACRWGYAEPQISRRARGVRLPEDTKDPLSVVGRPRFNSDAEHESWRGSWQEAVGW